MPKRRLARVGIGVLAIAVPATALVFVAPSAPAAETTGVAATVGVTPSTGSSARSAILIDVDVPGGKTWRAAADRQSRDFRASRSSSPHAFGTVAYSKWFARQYMQQEYGWGDDQFAALDQLWQHESGWNHQAHNTSSGAHGIPQALPGSKMGMFGADWATNPETQIKWGLHYIKSGYGSPSGALGFWNSHNWY